MHRHNYLFGQFSIACPLIFSNKSISLALVKNTTNNQTRTISTQSMIPSHSQWHYYGNPDTTMCALWVVITSSLSINRISSLWLAMAWWMYGSLSDDRGDNTCHLADEMLLHYVLIAWYSWLELTLIPHQPNWRYSLLSTKSYNQQSRPF